MTPSRRRRTAVPFSPNDAKLIGDAIAAGETLACPRCSEDLTVAEPIDRGDGTSMRAVCCESCGRNAMLSDAFGLGSELGPSQEEVSRTS